MLPPSNNNPRTSVPYSSRSSSSTQGDGVLGLSDEASLSKQLNALLRLSDPKYTQAPFEKVRSMYLRELTEQDLAHLVAQIWRLRLPREDRIDIVESMLWTFRMSTDVVRRSK